MKICDGGNTAIVMHAPGKEIQHWGPAFISIHTVTFGGSRASGIDISLFVSSSASSSSGFFMSAFFCEPTCALNHAAVPRW